MTELQELKKKKKAGKATDEELVRLKVLQDGEPLSAADLENAKKREADRATKDKEVYAARQKAKVEGMVADGAPRDINSEPEVVQPAATLDKPDDHPRIKAIKAALSPFTQIEAHSTRQDQFVLFTRGVSITAGDVRKARAAMKL